LRAAYALDLADWFVWLTRAGTGPLEATLATIESYKREALRNLHGGSAARRSA
jgi:hypothetical protein